LTERLSGNIVICKVTSGTLRKGQTISFLADGYCVERRVLSMQIDDADVCAMSFVNEVELGIKLDQAISRKKAAVLTNSAW
jgi:translation initiation factor IF-2